MWLQPQIQVESHLVLIEFSSNPNGVGGGLFLVFEDKSASKVQKSGYFAYSSGQWGGEYTPPPRPDYATDYESTSMG